MTCNLTWFMDLTFQVPMQYCCLQHQTLTTRHIHSWALFLLWPSNFILSGAICNTPYAPPSSILKTYHPGELIFWFHFFLPFHTAHGVFVTRIMEWCAISSSLGPFFFQNSSQWPVFLRWLCRIWLIASISFASLLMMTRLVCHIWCYYVRYVTSIPNLLRVCFFFFSLILKSL